MSSRTYHVFYLSLYILLEVIFILTLCFWRNTIYIVLLLHLFRKDFIMKKTNAARILDKMNIAYDIKEYEVDLNDLSAVHVAANVGMDIKMVFKTLVARGDKTGILMACIPGDDELNLKKLAAISNNKKVEMVHLKEVQGLTGYIRGGCSPLGAKKNYPVFLHESALAFPRIAISAGIRGQQLLLSPADLIKSANAQTADIIK